MRPDAEAEALVFHEIDVERVRLILELRDRLAVDETALPVVLSLLDQVYALRRRLRELGVACRPRGKPFGSGSTSSLRTSPAR